MNHSNSNLPNNYARQDQVPSNSRFAQQPSQTMPNAHYGQQYSHQQQFAPQLYQPTPSAAPLLPNQFQQQQMGIPNAFQSNEAYSRTSYGYANTPPRSAATPAPYRSSYQSTNIPPRNVITPGPYSSSGQQASAASSYRTGNATNTQASTSDRHKCPQCDKTFTRAFDCKRHLETHYPGSSGNHVCQYCGQSYSRSDSLKRHIDNGCDKKP